VRGHAFHTSVQRWLGNAGFLFGNWACSDPTCDYVERDRLGPPGICQVHGSELVYDEYEILFKGFSGHPDGFLPRGDTFSLLEIKSIQHQATAFTPGYETIEEPIPYHVEQANTYAVLAPKALDAIKSVDRIEIWYVSVDRPTWHPKVFRLKPDVARAKKHFKVMADIREALKKKDPPDCTVHSPFCTFSDFCNMPTDDLLRYLSHLKRGSV